MPPPCWNGCAELAVLMQYKNEALVGEGLKDFIATAGREQLFITSKVWNDCHRPKLVRYLTQSNNKLFACLCTELLILP